MSDNFQYDAINTTATLITITNVFIFVPVIIYGLCLFSNYRDNELIFYRNAFSVILMNILVINALVTERVLFLFVNIFQVIDVPEWILSLLFTLTWDAILYLKFVKVYYVYFQQQYHLSIANKVWKEQINPDNEDIDALWYIEHKNTFGNITYLIQLAFIPWILSILIVSFVSVFVGDIWVIDAVHLMVTLIPVCLSLALLHKTRVVSDIYRIRTEMFAAMFCIAIAFTGYIVVVMIRYSYSATDYTGFNRVESLANLMIMDVVAIACSLLSTMYPVYWIKRLENGTNIRQHAIEISQAQCDLQMLNEFMSNYTLFTAFMSYLVSEFCAESLMFLVELVQCKVSHQRKNNYIIKIPTNNGEYMMVDFNKNPFDANRDYKTENAKYFTYIFHDDGTIMTRLGLSPYITKTGILKRKKDYSSLREQMRALFEKYVQQQAPFEINLSYSVRSKLIQTFSESEEISDEDASSEMFNIMDEAAIEIVQLLQYSISRFLCSEHLDSVSDIHFGTNPEIENDTAFKELLNSEKTNIITYCNESS